MLRVTKSNLGHCPHYAPLKPFVAHFAPSRDMPPDTPFSIPAQQLPRSPSPIPFPTSGPNSGQQSFFPKLFLDHLGSSN